VSNASEHIFYLGNWYYNVLFNYWYNAMRYLWLGITTISEIFINKDRSSVTLSSLAGCDLVKDTFQLLSESRHWPSLGHGKTDKCDGRKRLESSFPGSWEASGEYQTAVDWLTFFALFFLIFYFWWRRRPKCGLTNA